jgi:hypothetical protein
MPSAEQRFTWHMTEAKEDHNRWWAKRMAFEGAGWPAALDKELLRARVRELEQARSGAFDAADSSADLEAEREFWWQAAGPRGV